MNSARRSFLFQILTGGSLIGLTSAATSALFGQDPQQPPEGQGQPEGQRGERGERGARGERVLEETVPEVNVELA
jgi:hypothetical protein